MDQPLAAKLDRLVGLPGNPGTGLPVVHWASALDGVDRDLLTRAVIELVRLLLTEKIDDPRPLAAVAATEAWLADKSPEKLAAAKQAAKDCTAMRSESFGFRHQLAEAARGVAWTCGAKDSTDLYDAIASAEGDMLARIALTEEFHKIPEQRKMIVETLKRVLIAPPPPPPKTEEAGPDLTTPVAYGASKRFAVGQHVTHSKFGAMVVTASEPTMIEVQLADGTTKRLAQKAL